MNLKMCPECQGFTYVTTACMQVKISVTGHVMRTINDKVDFNDIDQNATCECTECGFEAPLHELIN